MAIALEEVQTVETSQDAEAKVVLTGSDALFYVLLDNYAKSYQELSEYLNGLDETAIRFRNVLKQYGIPL